MLHAGAIFVFNLVAPLYIKAGWYLYVFLDSLPYDLFYAILGLGLCFFGGHYLASIAAVEAFAMTGWPATKQNLIDVYSSYKKVEAANKKDDAEDEDNNGIADVKEMPSNELVAR